MPDERVKADPNIKAKQKLWENTESYVRLIVEGIFGQELDKTTLEATTAKIYSSLSKVLWP